TPPAPPASPPSSPRRTSTAPETPRAPPPRPSPRTCGRSRSPSPASGRRWPSGSPAPRPGASPPPTSSRPRTPPPTRPAAPPPARAAALLEGARGRDPYPTERLLDLAPVVPGVDAAALLAERLALVGDSDGDERQATALLLADELERAGRRDEAAKALAGVDP